MKSELKVKFLQHILNKKKNEEGFTLIELLVVIIIIGILSAIALPSFLNQANKAKQSEAKTYVGSMNRAQQAQYLEAGAFAGTGEFGKLGLGVKTQTENYKYDIKTNATNGGSVTNQGQVLKAALKAYIGGVGLSNITATSEATTLAALCEAKIASGIATAAAGTEEMTFAAGAAPVCPTTTYQSLSK
jgi:type IV pilus assembly protein PilA